MLKVKPVSGRSRIQTRFPLTLRPVLSTIKSSLTVSICASETILAVTFHQHDPMGSTKSWCFSCQLLLTPEFLTPLPKLRPELQAHPMPHTPPPFFVSTSSHFFICNLIGGSLFPHYPSTSFIKVLLTQIGLWSVLTWAFPRASSLLWNSYAHSLMQIHLCCFSFQILIIINLPADIPSDSESPPCSININNSSIKLIYVLTVSWSEFGSDLYINFYIYIMLI